MKKKLTNKQKAYMVDYVREKTTRINMQLNNVHDADILEYMKTIGNKNAYLKDLVRQDMAKRNKK